MYTTEWFAWRPVRLTNGHWAWLRWVKRYRPAFALPFIEGAVYSSIDSELSPHNRVMKDFWDKIDEVDIFVFPDVSSEDCPTPDWLDDLQIDHTEIKYDHPDDESGGDPDE